MKSQLNSPFELIYWLTPDHQHKHLFFIIHKGRLLFFAQGPAVLQIIIYQFYQLFGELQIKSFEILTTTYKQCYFYVQNGEPQSCIWAITSLFFRFEVFLVFCCPKTWKNDIFHSRIFIFIVIMKCDFLEKCKNSSVCPKKHEI